MSHNDNVYRPWALLEGYTDIDTPTAGCSRTYVGRRHTYWTDLVWIQRPPCPLSVGGVFFKKYYSFFSILHLLSSFFHVSHKTSSFSLVFLKSVIFCWLLIFTMMQDSRDFLSGVVDSKLAHKQTQIKPHTLTKDTKCNRNFERVPKEWMF